MPSGGRSARQTPGLQESERGAPRRSPSSGGLFRGAMMSGTSGCVASGFALSSASLVASGAALESSTAHTAQHRRVHEKFMTVVARRVYFSTWGRVSDVSTTSTTALSSRTGPLSRSRLRRNQGFRANAAQDPRALCSRVLSLLARRRLRGLGLRGALVQSNPPRMHLIVASLTKEGLTGAAWSCVRCHT